MQVFVVGDRTHTVEVQPSDSVLDVKRNIFKTTGLAPAEQRLVFAGRQMQDANPLSQYNVQRGSTFQLLSRLLGSAQLGKAVKGKSKESVTQQHQRDKERKYRQRTQTMDEMDRRKKEAMKQKAMLRAHMEMEQQIHSNEFVEDSEPVAQNYASRQGVGAAERHRRNKTKSRT